MTDPVFLAARGSVAPDGGASAACVATLCRHRHDRHVHVFTNAGPSGTLTAQRDRAPSCLRHDRVLARRRSRNAYRPLASVTDCRRKRLQFHGRAASAMYWPRLAIEQPCPTRDAAVGPQHEGRRGPAPSRRRERAAGQSCRPDSRQEPSPASTGRRSLRPSGPPDERPVVAGAHRGSRSPPATWTTRPASQYRHRCAPTPRRLERDSATPKSTNAPVSTSDGRRRREERRLARCVARLDAMPAVGNVVEAEAPERRSGCSARCPE